MLVSEEAADALALVSSMFFMLDLGLTVYRMRFFKVITTYLQLLLGPGGFGSIFLIIWAVVVMNAFIYAPRAAMIFLGPFIFGVIEWAITRKMSRWQRIKREDEKRPFTVTVLWVLHTIKHVNDMDEQEAHREPTDSEIFLHEQEPPYSYFTPAQVDLVRERLMERMRGPSEGDALEKCCHVLEAKWKP